MNFLRRLALQEKKNWWQLASRCCWNRAHPSHASELVSFMVGLRTYQRPAIYDAACNIQNRLSHFTTLFGSWVNSAESYDEWYMMQWELIMKTWHEYNEDLEWSGHRFINVLTGKPGTICENRVQNSKAVPLHNSASWLLYNYLSDFQVYNY